VTSVDVLFHLRKEQLVLRAEEVESLEVEGQPPATDTMASLSRHVLQQRRSVFALPYPDLVHSRLLVSTHCFRLHWSSPTRSILMFLI
jgi:DNA polymerase alpha subunit B